MTLEQLIQQTLENLNEDTDEDTVLEYRDRIVAFINQAYFEICREKYRPEREMEITTDAQGRILNAQLPEGFLRAVEIRTPNGALLRHKRDVKGIAVFGYSGEVIMRYQYLPEEMESDEDTPIFEAGLHYCLADYATWRIMMTGSKQRQTRGEAFYNSYLLAVTKIRPQTGTPLRIIHKFERGSAGW